MREDSLLSTDWRFHLGDLHVPMAKTKSPFYIQAKAERKRSGPAARHCMDGTEHYHDTGLIDTVQFYEDNAEAVHIETGKHEGCRYAGAATYHPVHLS